MNIGERIRQGRKKKGLSQRELAQKMGIAPFALCRLEKPGSNPTFNTLEKIAKALGIPLVQLFAFEDPSGSTEDRTH